jgi:hypothetical protein
MSFLYGMAGRLRAVVLTLALVVPAGAQAATLGLARLLGEPLTSDTKLDVGFDGAVLSAENLFFGNGDLFIAAPLTPAGGVDAGLSNDLSFVDVATFDNLLVGRALDIAVDAEADMVSILYRLATNTLGPESFAVAVLDFEPYFDISEIGFTFADLNGQLADAEIYGATIIPLPAGILFLVTGLGGMGLFRVFRKATA